MPEVQIGIRGPSATKWKFRARTLSNDTFFLAEDGAPTDDPEEVAPYEGQSPRQIASQMHKRRMRYERRWGEEAEIEGMELVPVR